MSRDMEDERDRHYNEQIAMADLRAEIEAEVRIKIAGEIELLEQRAIKSGRYDDAELIRTIVMYVDTGEEPQEP